jgi:hypothetical protein
MKNYTLLFTATAGFFSFNCFAQQNADVVANTKWENTLVVSDKMSDNEFKVVSYHVEEKINQTFGSSTSTYTVSDLSLVNTNDLGPNNKRLVTPKYIREKVAVVTNNLPNAATKISSDKIGTIVSKEKKTSVKINILNTYERVLNKGYTSVEMLKKVADRSFFDDDLVMAAEWYCQLFEITADLEPVYYYRYAKCLLATNQIEKGNEMMRLFQEKK